jgi:cell division protein FtsW
MTCFALGIIINVTKKEEEIEQEQKEAAKREEALQKLIDQQLESDDHQTEIGNYSIQDSSKNPMDAVKNK